MKSMTGFGRAERHVGPGDITVEVRSYNNRFLDVTVSAPPALAAVEPALRTLIAGQTSRGRVELQIRLTGAVARPQVSAAGAVAAADLLRGIAGAAGLSQEITVQDVLEADRRLDLGVIQNDGAAGGDYEELCAGVLEAARSCLQRLDAERQREGVELAADLSACLQQMEAAGAALDSLASAWQTRLEQDVQARMSKLLTDGEAADRVVPAVALLLARADVNEELKRLHAHLEGMRTGIAADGPIGKKLEFYCQELLREANAIVSKAASTEIDAQVIMFKENLERMREQLRNVE